MYSSSFSHVIFFRIVFRCTHAFLLLLLANTSVVYALTAVRACTLLTQNIANGSTTPNSVDFIYPEAYYIVVYMPYSILSLQFLNFSIYEQIRFNIYIRVYTKLRYLTDK